MIRLPVRLVEQLQELASTDDPVWLLDLLGAVSAVPVPTDDPAAGLVLEVLRNIGARLGELLEDGALDDARRQLAELQAENASLRQIHREMGRHVAAPRAGRKAVLG